MDDKYYMQNAFEICAKSNVFDSADGYIYQRFELPSDNHFSDTGPQSTTVIGSIILTKSKPDTKSTDADEIRRINVVIKLLPNIRHLFTELTFMNEISIYQTVIPYLSKFHPAIIDLFPTFYYGSLSINRYNRHGIIILENLQTVKYRPTIENVFLNFQHISCMLKKLGEFHACSYIAKHEDPVKFNILRRKILDTHYSINDTGSTEFMAACVQRALKPLKSDPKYQHKIDKLNDISNNIFDTMNSILLTKSNDKTAVICHGDFIATNAMFLYNADEDEELIDCKFIDLANCTYNSPVIDLCNILYMNTAQKCRDEHWDTFLQIYYDSMQSVAKDVPIPSKSDILKEFKDNAVFGFILAAFFLPHLMRLDADKQENRFPILNQDDKDVLLPGFILGDYFRNCADEKAIEVTACIARDLIDRGFV